MPSGQFSIRVQPTLDLPGLRLRAQPTTASNTLAFEAPGALLTVLEAETTARSKLGVYNQWIQVRDANSLEGYVAAWYVEATSAGTTPTPTPATSTSTSIPTAPTVKAPSAQALVDAINAERAKKNVALLKANSILMSDAQKHAEYMASTGQITHNSADGSRPFQRHLAAGYPLAGDLARGGFASENIVMGTSMSIEEAIASWYGDDPHTQTMISDKYNECGAGVAVSGSQIYYCYDVARSTTASAPQATAAPTPPPTDGYTVYVPKSLTGGLRIRTSGSLTAGLVRVAGPGEWLAVQEPASSAKAKVGVQNAWLKVKDKLGNTGYVAAWLVSES